MKKNEKTYNNLKQLLQTNTGVTMIALIVTIIILIIIATIAIKGGTNTREDTKGQIQKSELEIVQHVILERYTKAQLTKETLPGTKISFNDANAIIEQINEENRK